MTIEVT